jgi:hypothetical protein
MTKLRLTDIADLRAYERERESFRAQVIELKKRRRVAVGPFVTVLFENRDTIRFQIQEMARVERIRTDEAIQTELDIYNDLIPGGDELVGTLFIEIDDPTGLREWLPRLVGIQRAIAVCLPDGTEARGEPLDEERLAVFRDFVNSLDVDLPGTGETGPSGQDPEES